MTATLTQTVDRRTTIRLGIATGALLFAAAHTPYQQWVVYRRRVLLIGSSRDDPEGYALCRRVAETLASDLPASRARASRAPTAGRLADLVATDQMDFAILPWPEAAALASGQPPHADLGGIALTGLFGFQDHVLVGVTTVPATHAYLVARTVHQAFGAEPGGGFEMTKAGGTLALHPGVQDYVAGRPMPEPDRDSTEGASPAHDHGG